MTLPHVVAKPASAEAISAASVAVATYSSASLALAANLDYFPDCLWPRATRASLGVHHKQHCMENSYHTPDSLIRLRRHSSLAAM